MTTDTDTISVAPIISVEEFFSINPVPEKPWEPLPPHTLEQSPCYPVIYIQEKDGLKYYRCKLHSKTKLCKPEGIKTTIAFNTRD